MAISTYNTTLEIGTTSQGTFSGTSYPVFDYPDLGQDPEQIDVTTLQDAQYKYIAGIKGSGALTFNANYDKDKLTTLNGYGNNVKDCVLTLQDGSTLKWSGYISARLTGKGVNERVEMAITVIPSTDITFTAYTPPAQQGAG